MEVSTNLACRVRLFNPNLGPSRTKIYTVLIVFMSLYRMRQVLSEGLVFSIFDVPESEARICQPRCK